MSKVGYKSPPVERQFGQPNGNPTGKTSAQKKIEMESAEVAARVQHRMLKALEGLMNENPEKEKIVEMIKGDPLRLLKDAMDRGYGTAVQKIDATSSDGSMTPPSRVELVAVPVPDANGKD